MKKILKALVAAALIAVLFYSVDWDHTLARIEHLPLWPLSIVLAIMIWELALSAWKWSWSLRVHGLHFELAYLLRVICIGYFLNNFLPTAIGGDAYRAFKTMPTEGYRSSAVSAVLVERLGGFIALMALGAGGALALQDTFPIARWYVLGIVSGALFGMGLLWAAHAGHFKLITNRVRHFAAFEALEHNFMQMKRARVEWLHLICGSLLFQATSIYLVYWLFDYVDAQLPWHHCALITAAAGIAAIVPLSINGIGLMEGSLVGMAVAIGAEYDSAVLVAVLRRLMMVVLSALCGGVYLTKERPVTAAA